MKRLIGQALTLILVLIMWAGPASAATAPKAFAGLILGENISLFGDKLRMDTAMPVRFQEYQWEVETKELPGIKTGIVTYGKCGEPSRIMRIRLKYEDSSKKFYEALLKQLKQRYGEPEAWKGDSFGMLYQWKWGFQDEKGNRITMILKHNMMDPDESFGNSLKLTMPDLFTAEETCYNKIQPTAPPKESKSGNLDWSLLLPR